MANYYTYNATIANALDKLTYNKRMAFDFKVAKQTNGKYCYPVNEFNRLLTWIKNHIDEFPDGSKKTKLQYLIDNEATIKALPKLTEAQVLANLEVLNP